MSKLPFPGCGPGSGQNRHTPPFAIPAAMATNGKPPTAPKCPIPLRCESGFGPLAPSGSGGRGYAQVRSLKRPNVMSIATSTKPSVMETLWNPLLGGRRANAS